MLFVTPTDLDSPTASSAAIKLTLQALTALGHGIALVSRQNPERTESKYVSRQFFSDSLESNPIREGCVSKHLRRLSRKIWFAQVLVLSAIKARREAHSADLIWTRSPLSLILLGRRQTRIILEIHSPCSRFVIRQIRRLAKRHLIVIAYNSSRQLRHHSSLADIPSVVARAAVQDQRTGQASQTEKFDFSADLFEVLYVGGFYSIGIPKGVSILLQACRSRDFPFDVRISVIGGSVHASEKLRSSANSLGIPETRLRFFPAVDSETAAELPFHADALLMIYNAETSVKLTSEGPRKLFEYARAQKPLISSRSLNVTEFLAEGEATFFLEDDCESLIAAIAAVSSDVEKAPIPSAEIVWTATERTESLLASATKLSAVG